MPLVAVEPAAVTGDDAVGAPDGHLDFFLGNKLCLYGRPLGCGPQLLETLFREPLLGSRHVDIAFGRTAESRLPPVIVKRGFQSGLIARPDMKIEPDVDALLPGAFDELETKRHRPHRGGR